MYRYPGLLEAIAAAKNISRIGHAGTWRASSVAVANDLWVLQGYALYYVLGQPARSAPAFVPGIPGAPGAPPSRVDDMTEGDFVQVVDRFVQLAEPRLQYSDGGEFALTGIPINWHAILRGAIKMLSVWAIGQVIDDFGTPGSAAPGVSQKREPQPGDDDFDTTATGM